MFAADLKPEPASPVKTESVKGNASPQDAESIKAEPGLDDQAATFQPLNGLDPAAAAALLRSPSPSAKVEIKPSIEILPEDLSHPAADSVSPQSTSNTLSSPDVKPTTKNGGAARRKREIEQERPVQFIHHLPRAEEQALSEFDVLEENSFQFKYLGRSGQQEDMMICDCAFDPGECGRVGRLISRTRGCTRS